MAGVKDPELKAGVVAKEFHFSAELRPRESHRAEGRDV